MTRGALVATVAYALLLGSSADDLRVSLRSTAAAYLSGIATIAPVAGRETTFDYYERLNQDLAMLDADVPQGYTPAEWSQMVDGRRRSRPQPCNAAGRSLVPLDGGGPRPGRGFSAVVARWDDAARRGLRSAALHARPAGAAHRHASRSTAIRDAAPRIVVDCSARRSDGHDRRRAVGAGDYDFRRSSTDVYEHCTKPFAPFRSIGESNIWRVIRWAASPYSKWRRFILASGPR